jgi:hypothetical protein
MVTWRIYYADGEPFDDSMGTPADAPYDGVLAIRQKTCCEHHPSEWMKQEHLAWHDSGYSLPLLEGADWYFWRDDVRRWFRTDLMGFIDQAKRKDARHLKQGEYVTHEQWESMLARVGNDPDFA